MQTIVPWNLSMFIVVICPKEILLLIQGDENTYLTEEGSLVFLLLTCVKGLIEVKLK